MTEHGGGISLDSDLTLKPILVERKLLPLLSLRLLLVTFLLLTLLLLLGKFLGTLRLLALILSITQTLILILFTLIPFTLILLRHSLHRLLEALINLLEIRNLVIKLFESEGAVDGKLTVHADGITV